MSMDKQQFRKLAQQRRAAIADRELKSASICRYVLESPEYCRARIVAFYFSYRTEVAADGLLPRILADGKVAAAPRICGRDMVFCRIFGRNDLEIGSYGIAEPKSGSQEVTPGETALILTPGCAFTRNGSRMGYGGGYYDRYLADCQAAKAFGLAFEEQLYEELLTDPWDIQLDGIITEKGIYRVSKGRRRF